ncbi:indole-3-glycerol phosphate synthase TrpC [Pradoshia sp.]
MSNYLTKIIESKKEYLKSQQFECGDMVELRRKRGPSFTERVRNKSTLGILAEFKRSSPSLGAINHSAVPTIMAGKYVRGGADGISILTDELYFNGHIRDLETVALEVDVPVLCKDFIIEASQINRAYQAGAGIILLIVRILNQEKLLSLYHHARQLGLEVLLEIHDEKDLEAAMALKPDLIGINNRNLHQFSTDLSTTESLMRLITDPDIIVVSESGIKSKEDCERVAAAGVDAVLIGEACMKHPQPEQFLAEINKIERRPL